MNPKARLSNLFGGTLDKEKADAPQTLYALSSPDVHNTWQDFVQLEGEASLISRSGEKTDRVDTDPEQGNDQEYNDAGTPTRIQLDGQPEAHERGLCRIFSLALSFISPSPAGEEIQADIPHYRTLPIISGIAIPFCIFLEIPGLTQPWYIRMNGSSIVSSEPNPPFFDAVIALSLCCGVAANVFIIFRFLEKRIKTMTILCVVFLSIHHVLGIAALALFGATAGGFTYGHAFWMTLCSTIVSVFTNVTLGIDLILTPDFKRSGSGLTRRQRSLVIIIIGLFCYLALGALINALLLDLTFINGLYFTIVTIETIGFGDIVPNNTRDRVFICIYTTLGMINLAFVVRYIHETVLEGIEFKHRERLSAIQERRRAARRRRLAEVRWKRAVIWRLRQQHAPIWVPHREDDRKSLWLKLNTWFWRAGQRILSSYRNRHESHLPGMKLNLWALPRCQLEAAALEAGVPLDTLLPLDFYDTYNPEEWRHSVGTKHCGWHAWFLAHLGYGQHATEPLTHLRLGAMAVMLTKMTLSVYAHVGDPLPRRVQDALAGGITGSSTSLTMNISDDEKDYHADVVRAEAGAYTRQFGLSWVWFLIFWMGGAFIFRVTEGWTFGQSLYFCFVSFSTIGYGDFAPTTQAGRFIFVVWALIGVATMTIFISIVSDAYTSRYKGILGRNSFKHVVQQYRKQTKMEPNEKAERLGIWNGVKLASEDEQRTDVIEESPVVADKDGDDSRGSGEDDDPTSTSRTPNSESEVHAPLLQRSLEQLPQRILTETHSVRQYMQLIWDEGSTEAIKAVNQTLWKLVDEVMNGQRLPMSTKVDILRDGESRRALMMLGIEQSLKELVNISQQATVAIQERRRITGERKLGGDAD